RSGQNFRNRSGQIFRNPHGTTLAVPALALGTRCSCTASRTVVGFRTPRTTGNHPSPLYGRLLVSSRPGSTLGVLVGAIQVRSESERLGLSDFWSRAPRALRAVLEQQFRFR